MSIKTWGHYYEHNRGGCIKTAITPTSLALEISLLKRNVFYTILKYCLPLASLSILFFEIFQIGLQYPVEMTIRIWDVHTMNTTEEEEASKLSFDPNAWNHNFTSKAQNLTNSTALDFK